MNRKGTTAVHRSLRVLAEPYLLSTRYTLQELYFRHILLSDIFYKYTPDLEPAARCSQLIK